MRTLEEIRRELAECDHELIHQLMRRMSLVSEIIPVKRESGIPIFQPDVEQSRLALFGGVLENENYRKNILHIFDQIVLESKKIQAEELIQGNIAIIGFMGVGKTSVAACLKDMLDDYDGWSSEDIYGNVFHDSFVLADAAPWGADKAYQLKQGGVDEMSQIYILCYPGRLVEIQFGWDVTQEQMEKIGNLLEG